MDDEINVWLNSGQDYPSGLLLYDRYCKNTNLCRILRVGGATGKIWFTLSYKFDKAIINLVYIETISTTFWEEIAKDKGHKFGFLCKQESPMAFYEGSLLMDPNPPVN